MRASGLVGEIAAFNLSSTGFDATNNRFTDYSPLGNHLVPTAAPIFVSQGAPAKNWLKFDPSFYGDLEFDMPSWTIIATVRANLLGADVLNVVTQLGTGTPQVASGDHAFSTIANTVARGSAQLDYTNSANNFYSADSKQDSVTMGTRGLAQVVCFSNNAAANLRFTQVNAGLPQSVATDAYFETRNARRWRVGYMAAAYGTGGSACSAVDLRLVWGDAITGQPAALAAFIAGQLADNPG